MNEKYNQRMPPSLKFVTICRRPEVSLSRIRAVHDFRCGITGGTTILPDEVVTLARRCLLLMRYMGSIFRITFRSWVTWTGCIRRPTSRDHEMAAKNGNNRGTFTNQMGVSCAVIGVSFTIKVYCRSSWPPTHSGIIPSRTVYHLVISLPGQFDILLKISSHNRLLRCFRHQWITLSFTADSWIWTIVGCYNDSRQKRCFSTVQTKDKLKMADLKNVNHWHLPTQV